MPDIDNKPAVGTAPAAQPASSPQEAQKPDPQSGSQSNPQSGNRPNPQSASGAAQPQPRPCPQDCTKCSLQQQVFCSASMMFRSFDVMNAVIQRLDRQQQTIDTLSERIAAMQSAEAELVAPQPIQGDLFAGA